MFFDTHMHTNLFSEDGIMTIDEAEAAAKRAGGVITLTEHFDYDFPPPFTFQFDPEEYFRVYGERRKEDFLLLGVEIGLQPSCAGRNDELVSRYPFDEVIGSTHLVEGLDIAEDEYFKGKNKFQAHRQYLETVYDNICRYENFDVMGHIDYIARYGPYKDRGLCYEEHRELIDAILKHLIQKNKILELNTRRLSSETTMEELKNIYSRYYELGGRYVTIGSDAHEASHIFANFQNAVSLMEACGLRQVYFVRRKWHLAIAE